MQSAPPERHLGESPAIGACPGLSPRRRWSGIVQPIAGRQTKRAGVCSPALVWSAPDRARTYNLGIKSALLCQLSYGGATVSIATDAGNILPVACQKANGVALWPGQLHRGTTPLDVLCLPAGGFQPPAADPRHPAYHPLVANTVRSRSVRSSGVISRGRAQFSINPVHNSTLSSRPS